jgi:hypothetical protein
MQRTIRVAGLAVAAMALALPASAQVVRSVSFGVGLFRPAGFDSRTSGDVLVENLSTFEPLAFRIEDFRAGQLFGEYHLGFGERVELALGAGFYSRSVPSVYRNLININGAEIAQDLRLRMVPVTGIVRLLAGRAGDIQPYIGGGVAALRWRYSEAGEFVDTVTYDVFADRYVSSGTNLGGVFVLGVRWPIGGDIYGFTTEYRYQSGIGDTGGNAAGFLADRIDLSGGHFNFGFLVRF